MHEKFSQYYNPINLRGITPEPLGRFTDALTEHAGCGPGAGAIAGRRINLPAAPNRVLRKRAPVAAIKTAATLIDWVAGGHLADSITLEHITPP